MEWERDRRRTKLHTLALWQMKQEILFSDTRKINTRINIGLGGKYPCHVIQGEMGVIGMGCSV